MDQPQPRVGEPASSIRGLAGFRRVADCFHTDKDAGLAVGKAMRRDEKLSATLRAIGFVRRTVEMCHAMLGPSTFRLISPKLYEIPQGCAAEDQEVAEEDNRPLRGL